MKDFKSRAEWKRVEEEFHIVYRLGLERKSADIKSAMMNVEALLASAYAEGLEAGAKVAGKHKHSGLSLIEGTCRSEDMCGLRIHYEILSLKETEHGKEGGGK